jgi:hypothetical protein
MTTGAGGDARIVATLRDGSEHTLDLSPDLGAATVLDEVSAGRSQLLRGWVAVAPAAGSTQAIIRGDEVVRLRLVSPRPEEHVDER